MSGEPEPGRARRSGVRVSTALVAGTAATALAAAVLTGCGGGTSSAGPGGIGGGGSASPAPRPDPSVAAVTAAPAGARVRLRVGGVLLVRAPRAVPGGQVTASLDSAGPPPLAGGRLLDGGFRYTAVRPGNATVVVVSGPVCAAGLACPRFKTLIGSVRVTVTA